VTLAIKTSKSLETFNSVSPIQIIWIQTKSNESKPLPLIINAFTLVPSLDGIVPSLDGIELVQTGLTVNTYLPPQTQSQGRTPRIKLLGWFAT
jgi:hypothetical protein